MHLDHPLPAGDLHLATLTAAHAGGAYLRWMNDPDVARFLESRHGHHDGLSLERFIAETNASRDSLLLGIFHTADKVHIGNLKIGPIDRRDERASIGLVIDRPHWSKGYATLAIAAASDYAFRHLGVYRLMAGVYDGNDGSVRAFQKCGYVLEARLRRHWKTDQGRVDGLILGRLRDDVP